MKVQKQFEALLKEAQEIEASSLIKTQEARSLLILIKRMIEIQVHGEPKTPMPVRHHA